MESVTTKETTSKTSDDGKSAEDKMEIPVAYGRWGKPKCLLEAKYDFLILDATVASTKDPLDRVQIGILHLWCVSVIPITLLNQICLTGVTATIEGRLRLFCQQVETIYCNIISI